MSKSIKTALNVGHAPRKVIDSPIRQALAIGAFDEDYAAAYKAQAAASIKSTLADLDFDEATIERMLARRA